MKQEGTTVLSQKPEGTLAVDAEFDTHDASEVPASATVQATSPVIEQTTVREAQKLLNKNPYADFWDGPLDGKAGRTFNTAVKDAKFALGYPKKQIKPGFGLIIKAYLKGEKKLPVAYRVRRKARIKAGREAEQKAFRKEIIRIAKTQLGIEESPRDSNNVKYARWYGANFQPWCAQFVSWCTARAVKELGATKYRSFSKMIDPGSHWAFCPFIEDAARDGRNGLRVTHNPQPGDWILYQFDADANADHIGIFENGNAQSFNAIEGNTALGNDANGGAVMRRARTASVVRCFIRCVGE